MKYKLKKKLTKEDFSMTKWRVPNLSAAEELLEKSIEVIAHPKVNYKDSYKFQQIFFFEEGLYADCYYNEYSTKQELDFNFESYKDHREMNFDDYFEEDLPHNYFKTQITTEEKDELYNNGEPLIGKEQILTYARGADDMEKIMNNKGVYCDPAIVAAARNTNPGPCEPEYEGSFEWAVDQIKDNFELDIRRRKYLEWRLCDTECSRIYNNEDRIEALEYEDIFANDWYIHKEEHTIIKKEDYGKKFDEVLNKLSALKKSGRKSISFAEFEDLLK